MAQSLVTIRRAVPVDAPGIAAAHVASWEETYDGLMPQSIVSALSVADRELRWKGILSSATTSSGPIVFVAVANSGIVGFASGGIQRDEALAARGYSGEITAIYLLQDFQGRGTGHALMCAVAGALAGRGYEGATLWVLRGNWPARRFYEKLGGEIMDERTDVRDGTSLVEIAYGWRDLTAAS